MFDFFFILALFKIEIDILHRKRSLLVLLNASKIKKKKKRKEFCLLF